MQVMNQSRNCSKVLGAQNRLPVKLNPIGKSCHFRVALRISAKAKPPATQNIKGAAQTPEPPVAINPKLAIALATVQSVSFLTGSLAFTTIYAFILFLLMLFFPSSKNVYDIARNHWTLLPLVVLYVAILVASWTPDTLTLMLPGSLKEGLAGWNPQFLPSISGISTLFSRVPTAVSFWVHVVAVNLFIAMRCIYVQGYRAGLPIRHSLLLCMLCGPLGLAAHLLTQEFYTRTGTPLFPPQVGPVVKGMNGGTVMILPYESLDG